MSEAVVYFKEFNQFLYIRLLILYIHKHVPGLILRLNIEMNEIKRLTYSSEQS